MKKNVPTVQKLLGEKLFSCFRNICFSMPCTHLNPTFSHNHERAQQQEASRKCLKAAAAAAARNSFEREIERRVVICVSNEGLNI